MTQPPETLEVDTHRVACDGGTFGHPRVYLDLTVERRVDCPYCGRRFVLKEGAKAPAGH
ncbi:MAG: zinc-finger domain-containing protein [Alphaproteobacteria bacterium]